MNRIEKQKFIVGLVVTIVAVCLGAALVKARLIKGNRGECIILTELKMPPGIKVGDVILLEGVVVGAVEKVSPQNNLQSAAVRAWIKPSLFLLIDDNAVLWSEVDSKGKTVLQLKISQNGAKQSLTKIKIVKGVNGPP